MDDGPSIRLSTIDTISFYVVYFHYSLIHLARSSGGRSEVAPPVPIPNTEVKRLSADDTEGVTLWENMPLPGVFYL